MTYLAAADRYEQTPYRRCGRSGLKLPEVSLGLWQNFGDERPLDGQRKILRRAFDLGVTHFDLANNYGPPYGSAEINFGRIMRELATAVTSGKALYAGISSYSAQRTAEAAGILRQLGTPLLIHQPSYSMLNRWIEEDDLLGTLELEGAGCIAFSPLAQGVLTGKYLNGIPASSRARQDGTSLAADQLTDATLGRVRALNEIARARGQSLAQLALAWALRDQRVTSVLIGASSVAQLEENLAAAGHSAFTAG